MYTKGIKINLLWISLFSISMGYLESAVVVYLRAVYYPEGFGFPVVNLNHTHLVTEVGREIATIIMLAGIGIIAGRSVIQKFAVFLYSFAIWDIVYYVFLKILLNWPESVMTWDLLFMVPTIWSGPVLSPVISSLTMIFYAFYIMYAENYKIKIINKNELTILIAGAFIVFVSYIWDYSGFVTRNIGIKYILNINKVEELSLSYIPLKFPWIIYITGETLIILSIILSYVRIFNKTQGTVKHQ